MFVFGTLRDMDILASVAGDFERIAIRKATLSDHQTCIVAGQTFPFMRAETGEVAHGLVLENLSAEQHARLVFYEDIFRYRLGPVTLDDGRDTQAFWADHLGFESDGPWLLDVWQARHKALALECIPEVMSHFPHADRVPVGPILMRARSRLRARKHVRGVGLASDIEGVEIIKETFPYSFYFALEDVDLKHKKFDGSWSEDIRRAVFVSADAVTVLPYDPVTDQVVLIEQFRVGPVVRRDPHPWLIEVIAGRCDGDEPPEEVARREAQEEAGLNLKTLELMSSYYPSPGCMTEYLYSYVGITDLSDYKVGEFGLEGEHEDIRTLVISYDDYMAFARSGEANNGPVLLSALWLAANRDRLRAAYGA